MIHPIQIWPSIMVGALHRVCCTTKTPQLLPTFFADTKLCVLDKRSKHRSTSLLVPVHGVLFLVRFAISAEKIILATEWQTSYPDQVLDVHCFDEKLID